MYSSLQIILLHSSKQRNQLLAQCHLIYLQNQRKFLPTRERHEKCGFSLSRSLPKSGPKLFHLSGKVDKTTVLWKVEGDYFKDEEDGHFCFVLRFSMLSYVVVLNSFMLSSSKSMCLRNMGENTPRYPHFKSELKCKNIHTDMAYDWLLNLLGLLIWLTSP